MKIRLVMLGKTRRGETRALLDDYLPRIRRYTEIQIQELPNSAAAVRKLRPGAGASWVLLDPGGKQLTSPQFARWLADLRGRGTRELVFLCGDAEGFPDELQHKAEAKLALSPMTLPHELARVVLVEQIYRAYAFLAGHPYPK
jgi:23S rRNA (pseudouridine1915-N3)-methyltransferase